MRVHFLKLIILLVSFLGGNLLLCAQDRDEEFEKLKEYLLEESIKEGDTALEVVKDLEAYADTVYHDLSTKLDTRADLPSDTAKILKRPYNRDDHWWWTLLKEHKLDLKDTTVVWPKFLKFCLNVYNWADKTFNTYDPEYVIGTGKRWKARLVSDNWLDSYDLHLPQKVNVTMTGNVYANLGAYVQYMAVSLGYSYDIEKLFNGKEPAHKKFEFGFICALFNAELYYHENRGGVNIRRFGNLNNGKLMREYFPGVSMYTLGIDAYYFFNNKKYSQGAAYNFAKYQLKSQGSFLAGISITNQKLTFDFNQLPPHLKEELPEMNITKYYFHYNSYALLGGYGYNWVIAPKLLFNVTVMPSIGFSHYYADSFEGDKYLLSLNIQGRLSLTYNLGNYFIGIFGKMNGHFYKQGQTSLFSSIENFSANIGLRF